MSSVRQGTPGATRVCPHCKATVLESAAICPGCRHHLRFNAAGTQLTADEGYCALSVDGTITHKVTAEGCEYCVVIDIRNERGEQVVRHVVGVGALQPGELRRVNVSVDMTPVRVQIAARPPAPLNAPPPPAVKPQLQPPPAVKLPPATAKATANASPPAPASAPAMPSGKAALQPPVPAQPQAPGSAAGERLGIFRKP
jgi:hypothetical protein